MNNTIQYKGYLGSVEFSEEDGIFYGKVMGIRSLISYEGENAKIFWMIFMELLMIILKPVNQKERNQKLLTKEVLTSEFLQTSIKDLSSIQQHIRCH